jgi:hypothetical protein
MSILARCFLSEDCERHCARKYYFLYFPYSTELKEPDISLAVPLRELGGFVLVVDVAKYSFIHVTTARSSSSDCKGS